MLDKKKVTELINILKDANVLDKQGFLISEFDSKEIYSKNKELLDSLGFNEERLKSVFSDTQSRMAPYSRTKTDMWRVGITMIQLMFNNDTSVINPQKAFYDPKDAQKNLLSYLEANKDKMSASEKTMFTLISSLLSKEGDRPSAAQLAEQISKSQSSGCQLTERERQLIAELV